MPAGRLSKRTPAIEDDIVARLSHGEPLAVICRDINVGTSTVYDWMDADEEFSGRIARAREIGFDQIAMDALAIVDAQPERVITTSGEDRTESRIDSASVQWAKNRAETRLKLLAKWDPKRYGDKMALTGGDEGDKPLTVQIIKP